MKKASLLMVIGIILAVLPGAALSQSGITWDSEIIIMNLGTDTAEVTVYYYNNIAAGGGLNTSQGYSIALGSSIRIHPLDPPAGFNGSVVIESTEPISVIVNEMGDYPTYDASYAGFEAGANEVRLPNLQSCNSGYYSFFNVQNAGSEPTTVTVDFIDWQKPDDFTPSNETCDLDPGEACTFSQEPGSGQWPARADCYHAPHRWIGGAKITSSGQVPVVAAANIVHADGDWGLSSYSGFTGEGSLSVILPNIMHKNGPPPTGDEYWSGIAVANVGTGSTQITYKFYPASGFSAIPDRVIPALAQDSLDFMLMGPGSTGLGEDEQWIGAVVVESNSQPIFAINNTLSNKRGELSAWKGIDPATATDTIYAPIIVSDDLPGEVWWSGFAVYNLDTSATASVTVEFSECGPPYCATAWTPVSETRTVGPRSVNWWLQSGDWPNPYNKWDTNGYYFGNAKITSDGPNIVAIVNMLGSTLQDTGELTNSYNGLNR